MHEKLHGKVVPNKTEGLYFRESNVSSEQMNPYFTSQSYGAFAVISTPTDLVAVTANSESTCIYPICRIKHLSMMIVTKVVHSLYMMSCSVGQCENQSSAFIKQHQVDKNYPIQIIQVTRCNNRRSIYISLVNKATNLVPTQKTENRHGPCCQGTPWKKTP